MRESERDDTMNRLAEPALEDGRIDALDAGRVEGVNEDGPVDALEGGRTEALEAGRRLRAEAEPVEDDGLIDIWLWAP